MCALALCTHTQQHVIRSPLSLPNTHTRTRTAVARNATPRALQQRLARLAALGTLQHHSCLGLLSRLFRLFLLLRLGLARRLVRSPVRALALWETCVTLPPSLSLALSLSHTLTGAAVLHLVAPRALAERHVRLVAPRVRTPRHPLARMLVSRPVLHPTG
jgi:hypothetical protein